jgi:hypothetical protein
MKKIALVLLALMILTVATLAADIALLPVQSSLIEKAGYDAATQTLVVKLVNGSDVYTYQAVPQAIYDGLLAAESKGSYFVQNIKGHFKTDKAE